MNSPDLINQLAQERSRGTESLRLSWLQALSTYPDLPEGPLKLLAGALPSPEAARQLALYMAREDDPAESLEAFLDGIDESEESFADWLAAFEIMARYLRGTAHRPTLTEAAGYLHCCEEVVDSGARYETFPMAVQTMLDTYGYEGNT